MESNNGRITLKLTVLQMDKLDRAGNGSGGNQTLCRKLHKRINEQRQTWVSLKDLERMKRYANRPDKGTWQRLYRKILSENGVGWFVPAPVNTLQNPTLSSPIL